MLLNYSANLLVRLLMSKCKNQKLTVDVGNQIMNLVDVALI